MSRPRAERERITADEFDALFQTLRRGSFLGARSLRPRPLPLLSIYVNTFTARAITRPRMPSEISDWIPMAIFAQGASGITSVGLNAVAFVKPRYR